jgi:hypothetical protein
MFGRKFVGAGELETPGGRTVRVLTVWMLADGVPHLNSLLRVRSTECEGVTEDVLKELDPVALLEDLPAHGLEAGDVGTVVFVHHAGEGYEVEFMDADGRTLVVETLQAHQVGAIRGRQILHVRPLPAA